MTKHKAEHYREMGKSLIGVSDTIEEPEGSPSRVNIDADAALENTSIYR